MNLAYLKSGTDIRGVAVGDNLQLTDEIIERIALAFLSIIKDRTEKEYKDLTICVGHDSRISADRIKNALMRAFSSKGVKTYDCGLSSTPSMFTVCLDTGCDASVQITASHHPYDKNGLKFFTKDGGFEGSDISEILSRAEKLESVGEVPIKVEKLDYRPVYCDRLKKLICDALGGDRPLQGLHIVTDAGNGAGGFFATDVLAPLGADITGSEFLEPDGMFPNHIPNPENETAMGFICRSVLKNKADLGVIFDTDVDRAACVGADGQEINRNALVALASVIALENSPGGTIVTDSVTSDGLKKFIEQHLGGVHYRYKRGYKNVINKALELNENGIDCPLAIETSGHAALRENYFLDDGAYLMVRIIILLARLKKENRDLSDLLKDLEKPAEAKEIRYKINTYDFKGYGENVLSELQKYCSEFDFLTPADDNREGFRVSFDKNHGDGWLLLRLSVHDPVLPLNIESNSVGGVQIIENFFTEFVRKFDKLSIK
jgi:phosphomannomutase